MATREVQICDKCNEEVAKHKCARCDNDICDKCLGTSARQKNTRVFIDSAYGFSKDIMCKDCREIISNVLRNRDAREEVSKIIDELVEKLHRLGLAAKL